MKPLIFHSEARAELEEDALWYDRQTGGLGDDFVTEVEKATIRLRRNPGLSPPHGKRGFRKAFVERFPYTLYFLELPDTIWIAAVAHQSRRPNYWRNRRPE